VILDLHGDLPGLVDRVQLQRAVGEVVRVADVGLLLELLHDQHRLLVAPAGCARAARAELVVDALEVDPLAMREQHALDVELGGPGEAALVLGIAVGDVAAAASRTALKKRAKSSTFFQVVSLVNSIR
jgi:hypothetical protein